MPRTKQWNLDHLDEVRASRRKWYKNNIEHAKSKVYERRRSIREWLEKLKAASQCAHCGCSTPVCLDFHHVDPNNKVGEVANLRKRGLSTKRLQEEIDKCIVLCANCHRIYHYS